LPNTAGAGLLQALTAELVFVESPPNPVPSSPSVPEPRLPSEEHATSPAPEAATARNAAREANE